MKARTLVSGPRTSTGPSAADAPVLAGAELGATLNQAEAWCLQPASLKQEGAVHFVKIGNRALNLDSVTHCECQIWHDSTTLKIYFSGAANNTPIVLSEEEAKLLWKYLESVAQKPVA